MVRLSNGLIGALNVITLMLSIPILGGGIWLTQRAATDCERFLDVPLVALGVFAFLVSLAGCVGAYFRNSCLLWLYLVVMLLLIILLVCFTLFAFVVTNKGASHAVSGRGFPEYRLGDYSHWLQRRVDSAKNWRSIRSCLVQGKVCKSLQNQNQTWDQFIDDNLSPIQSGCCKPPSACNFTYINGTAWTKPPGFYSSDLPDCNSWQNDPSTLCYDCQSCKAGVLANLKHDWKKIAVINFVLLIFLVVIYLIGCCAFRNDKDDRYGKVHFG
ncbi:unnamed protein product [Musa acuminata subsp. malaccensis]|uniref:(wild Malaysian banana) hypothetical protein n=1 Tax=Musa acuminata subsp. malaccensis TaxID=214687 RepID=A0A804IHM8_MUSAM|nr:unnamed protein product [Musa acuminata subsp. malaccensis]